MLFYSKILLNHRGRALMCLVSPIIFSQLDQGNKTWKMPWRPATAWKCEPLAVGKRLLKSKEGMIHQLRRQQALLWVTPGRDEKDMWLVKLLENSLGIIIIPNIPSLIEQTRNEIKHHSPQHCNHYIYVYIYSQYHYQKNIKTKTPQKNHSPTSHFCWSPGRPGTTRDDVSKGFTNWHIHRRSLLEEL